MIGLELGAIWALTWRDLLRFSRDRAQIPGAVGRPAIWMLLFAGGLRGAVGRSLEGSLDYGQFAYAGAISMTMLFGGMFQGVTIVWDREFGFLREMLVGDIDAVSRPDGFDAENIQHIMIRDVDSLRMQTVHRVAFCSRLDRHEESRRGRQRHAAQSKSDMPCRINAAAQWRIVGGDSQGRCHRFRRTPAGRHVLKLCRAEACQSVGADALHTEIKKRLGVGWHETTMDDRVTLEPVFCLGLCACGPAALVDDKPVGRVTADGLQAMLAERH